MKLSVKQREHLYAAIQEPIMNLRLKKLHLLSPGALDYELSQLTSAIWSAVRMELEGSA